MPLTQLWEKNPEIVLQYNVKQIVSAAGNGVLTDGSECSTELRHYLRNIPEPKLYEHIKTCMEEAFDKGGFVLQDLVNEIGHRLDYKVENGLYQGRSNKIGFDGIWEAPGDTSIIIEIKTTDAYRINLDSIAAYRSRLIESQRISKTSSILIVVARQDTGDLEAQIRGSRHAWDTRVISVEALIKLLELKINSDEEETTEKIRSLLIPFEYTRLDNIIDVIFTAAKDAETSGDGMLPAAEVEAKSEEDEVEKQEHTPRLILDESRDAALAALGLQEDASLVAHKRAQYWSADRKVRAVCPVSKKYAKGDFWFAFHPRQWDFIKDCEHGYLLLCCLDHPYAYAISQKELGKLLPALYKTEREDRYYWHINLYPDDRNEYFLKTRDEKVYLKPFQLSIKN